MAPAPRTHRMYCTYRHNWAYRTEWTANSQIMCWSFLSCMLKNAIYTVCSFRPELATPLERFLEIRISHLRCCAFWQSCASWMEGLAITNMASLNRQDGPGPVPRDTFHARKGAPPKSRAVINIIHHICNALTAICSILAGFAISLSRFAYL